MLRTIGLVATLSVAMAGFAHAQNYSTDRFAIQPTSDGEGCFIQGDWMLAGRSTIYLDVTQEIDQDVFVGVWSYGWSRPTADANKVLGVLFWDAAGERQVFALAAIPTGVEIGEGAPGLLAMVGDDRRAEFLTAFASNQSFTILARDLEAEDDVEFDILLEGRLQGSSLAVTRLRTCVSDVRRREEERREREAGVAHIERDPFRRGE
jgi:hypothetical protein